GPDPTEAAALRRGRERHARASVRAHLAGSRNRLRHRRQRSSQRHELSRGPGSRGDNGGIASGVAWLSECRIEGMRPEQRAAATPLVGTTLANAYRIVRLMGEGAMGGIYEAR